MGIDPIVRGATNSVAMVPSTAVCFIMLGSCMMTVRLQSMIEQLIFIISLIGMFVLFGFIAGQNFSLPTRNFVDVLNFDLRSADGMAWGTGLGISLLAVSLVIMAIGQSQVRTYVLALVSIAALLLFIAAFVKMWSPDFAFAMTLFGQMSIPTLILLMVATAGLAAFSLTATAR